MSELEGRTLRFSKELWAQLKSMAGARRVSISALVEGMLEDSLSGTSDKDRLRGLEERAASLDRRLKALRYDIEVLGEILSFFIYQWLCCAPQIPDNAREAIAAEGKARHKRFLQTLSGKLMRGDFSIGDLFGKGSADEEPGDPEKDPNPAE